MLQKVLARRRVLLFLLLIILAICSLSMFFLGSPLSLAYPNFGPTHGDDVVRPGYETSNLGAANELNLLPPTADKDADQK